MSERGGPSNPNNAANLPLDGVREMGPIRIIRAEDFITDNQSELAQNKIRTWYDNYQQGKVYLRVACSDARPVFDEELVWNQRSVAGGFPHKDSYIDTYTNSRIPAIVVDTHYGQFEIGKRPEGCGGQDTKAKINAGSVEPAEGITEFVHKNVHEDPIIQGILQAREIIDRLGRGTGRVFVTTQDHRTGRIIPVAEYMIEDGVEHRDIPIEFRPFLKARTDKEREQAYLPEAVYANGIPHLSESTLSPAFREYLILARKKVARVQEKYPDFNERQAVQNPWALVISTNKMPIQNRYPTLFGELASAFQVDLPRLKSVQGVVTVPEDAITSAVGQIEYAIKHAIENHGNPNADFSKSKMLFIETGSLDQSKEIARRILEKHWAKRWIALGGRVLVAETHGADTYRAEEYQQAPLNTPHYII